ncbi:hypothetical protein ABFX02_05G074300 [Erythranthe guttata]
MDAILDKPSVTVKPDVEHIGVDATCQVEAGLTVTPPGLTVTEDLSNLREGNKSENLKTDGKPNENQTTTSQCGDEHAKFRQPKIFQNVERIGVDATCRVECGLAVTPPGLTVSNDLSNENQTTTSHDFPIRKKKESETKLLTETRGGLRSFVDIVG